MTVNPKLADRNQQDTLPHVRLMEWVWGYFVDSSTDTDTQHGAGHKSSTRAGAVHAQPSKQASGSSHWQGQEDDKLRKQQRTDGKQTVSSSSREVISKTGRSILLLTKATQQNNVEQGLLCLHQPVMHCILQGQDSSSGTQQSQGASLLQKACLCCRVSSILQLCGMHAHPC